LQDGDAIKAKQLIANAPADFFVGLQQRGM
jgi:hypothetical protein